MRMHNSTTNPAKQIPWFATSHGHIDLQTSKDWRGGKAEEHRADEGTQEGVGGRKSREGSKKGGEHIQKSAGSKPSAENNKTSAGSNQRRKQSSSSNKVGVGGLPPLVVQSRGRPIMEESSAPHLYNFEKFNKEDILLKKNIIDDLKVGMNKL